MRHSSIGDALLLFAGMCAASGQKTDTLPQLPLPSGPFGIGRIGYHWVDSSRMEPYSSQPNAHRELMVYFWYPTSAKSPDAKGPYLPGAQRMDARPDVQPRMRREFGATWPAIVSGAIFSHAVEHAPPATSPRQLPMVTFSHGLGGTGFDYTCLIEDLVSRGYIVASIVHTYTAIAVWFPDGRIVLRHDNRPPAGLSPDERLKRMMAQATVEIEQGATDIRFVLDQMTAENLHSQNVILAGRIDLNRIVAMGHSAGAEFAARACQLDARFKACVDLDGPMIPVAALPEYPDGATLKQPLLFLEAEHPESQMAGTPAEHAAYFKKKEEQLQASRPGSYDVILRSPGIAHPSFSDTPLLFAGHDGYPPTATVLHNHALIEKYISEFLGKTLQHERAPLLEGANGPDAEATVQRYGR